MLCQHHVTSRGPQLCQTRHGAAARDVAVAARGDVGAAGEAVLLLPPASPSQRGGGGGCWGSLAGDVVVRLGDVEVAQAVGGGEVVHHTGLGNVAAGWRERVGGGGGVQGYRGLKQSVRGGGKECQGRVMACSSGLKLSIGEQEGGVEGQREIYFR